MQIENIGSRREVCWDEFLMDRVENISVKMHHPQFRNIALTCDAPWEGNNCGFFILLPEQNRLRLYYRTGQYDFSDGVMKRGHSCPSLKPRRRLLKEFVAEVLCCQPLCGLRRRQECLRPIRNKRAGAGCSGSFYRGLVSFLGIIRLLLGSWLCRLR